MKICPKCHSESDDGARFCIRCGAALDVPDEKEAASAKSEPPAPTVKEKDTAAAEKAAKNEKPAAHGKVCGKCGAPAEEGMRFCIRCGAALDAPEEKEAASAKPEPPAPKDEKPAANGRVCMKCGAPIEEGMRFCIRCGAAIDAPEEKKAEPEKPGQPAQKGNEMNPDSADNGAQTENPEEPKPTGRFCMKCGAPLGEGMRFCIKCGAAVDGDVKPDGGAFEKPRAPKPAKAEKQPRAPKKKKNGSGKVKRAFNVALQVLLVILAAASLALGLGSSWYFGSGHFRPDNADKQNASLVSKDGTVAVTLEYAPESLLFKKADTADLSLKVENLSEDTVSGLSLSFTLPEGLALTEENFTLSAERLGPGASRTFRLPIEKQDALGDNMAKVIGFMAATAVITTVFIVLYALARRAHVRMVMRTLALVLVLALILPGTTAFAANSGKKIGDTTLIYDEEGGAAKGLSVEIESGGEFDIGENDGGALSYTANYSLEQRLTVDAGPDEDGMLRISWRSISGAQKYRVVQVFGEEENTLDTVKDNEYTTEMPYYDSVSCFRIVAETKKGDLYSEDVRIIPGYDDDGRIYVDGDSDLLPNDVERAFGTSVALADTDGDGLTDYYEITYTLTDPLSYDTDNTGIGDGDKDPDGDGLTNREEARNGTNPLCADSDGDGVDDFTELNEMHTSPVNRDTDGDGLTDGTERRIKSDPLSLDSTGNGESDIDAAFTTEITDSRAPGVTLDLTDSGLGLSVSKAEDITDSTTLEDLDYLASPVVSVEVSEDTYGTVTVPVNEPETGEEVSDDDIALGVFDPETGDFHVVEDAEVSDDGSTVTGPLTDEYFTPSETVADNGETVATRRMVYCAFYIPGWHMKFEAPLTPDRGEVFFDVEFVIDESSSMEDPSKSTPNDPERFRVLAAKNFIEHLTNGDRAAVVGFNEEARRKIELTDDLAAVSAAVDTIVGNAGGTALYNGITEALNELLANEDQARGRFIIALTDGEDSADGTAQYDEIIRICTEHGIPIYTIALGTSVNTSLLSRLATYTGGAFFHIRSADDLPSAFNRIESNAFYGEDTDGDGLADEIEEHGLRDGVGNIYKTDAGQRFTDSDDMSDGEEAGNVMYTEPDENGDVLQYYIMITDPTKGDTDGDGLDDLDEKLLGTLPWCADTDGDGLSDGKELAIGYDPLEANFDGDTFNDGEEYGMTVAADILWNMIENGTAGDSPVAILTYALVFSAGDLDPYSYDLNVTEKMSAIISGALLGDFGDPLAEAGLMNEYVTNSLYYLLGQTIADFIPGVNIAVSLRDATADFIEGDYIGMGLSLTGLIPDAGGVIKAVSDVCDFLSKVYDGVTYVSEYAGNLTVRRITSAPAFTFTILRVIKLIEKMFGIDFVTGSIDDLVYDQIRNGTAGMTKESVRNFETFLGYGDYPAASRPKNAVDIADSPSVDVGSTALPVELTEAVRTALGTVPGGILEEVSGSVVYTLTRTFDLEAPGYGTAGILELALRDAIDRTADYNEVDKVIEARVLQIAVPDCVISYAVESVLENIGSYASERGVELRFMTYITTDRSPSADTESSEGEEVMLPGIKADVISVGANAESGSYGVAAAVGARTFDVTSHETDRGFSKAAVRSVAAESDGESAAEDDESAAAEDETVADTDSAAVQGKKTDYRAWIFIGIGIFMVVAAVTAIIIITVVIRPKKEKTEEAGKKTRA